MWRPSRRRNQIDGKQGALWSDVRDHQIAVDSTRLDVELSRRYSLSIRHESINAGRQLPEAIEMYESNRSQET